MPEPLRAPLSTAERLALRRYANEHDLSLEQAAAELIRDQLIAGGWLEWEEEGDDRTA